jgi:hypothetical protein
MTHALLECTILGKVPVALVPMVKAVLTRVFNTEIQSVAQLNGRVASVLMNNVDFHGHRMSVDQIVACKHLMAVMVVEFEWLENSRKGESHESK